MGANGCKIVNNGKLHNNGGIEMLVRAKKVVLMGVMALSVVAISLPVVCLAATSPSVTVLSPLSQGLRTPVKIALDVSGNIYVADQRAGGVVKFDAYGVQQMVIRTAVPSAGIAFAQDGSLLVSQATFVARYDVTTGLEIGRLDGGQLVAAAGIAVDDVTGYVYVVDSRAGQIVVYTASGAYSRSFAKGMFVTPTGIAFEKVSRQLAVADTYGNKVQFFDTNGVFVKSIGDAIAAQVASISPMQFAAPVAVAFEYSKDQVPVLNRMYVVDSYMGNVQVVDPVASVALNVAGAVNNYIGSAGTANGALMVPSDVFFDAANNRLLVVNGFGNITIYGVDGGKNPVYVAVNPPPVVVVDPAPALTAVGIPSMTRSSVITISGTVDAGATVSVRNQATSKSVDAVVTGGSWSCDVVLAEGANGISITAQKVNSEKAFAATAVTLDTTPPLLVVSALANGSYTSTPVQNVSGTVTDLNSATVTVNGAPVVLSGNSFSVPVTLVNGANQISVVAVDAVGNTSADSRSLFFDATKPVVVINSPVDNSTTSNAVLALSGAVDKVATVTVAGVAAAVDANNNWNATIELVNGVNTVEIVATDLSGNTSSVKRSVTLDTAKPALAIVTPAQDLAVNVPNVLLSGTVSDATLVTLEYSVGGSPAVAVPVDGGKYSFNVDFATEGNYSITLTAKDAAGNTSTSARNVIYDVTAPLFTLNSSNGYMPEKLSGTVEAGSAVVVIDGSLQVGIVSVNNGTWLADLSGVNYTPENLRAVATDAAGNSTSKSLVYNYPDGTLNAGSAPTVNDALRAIRIAVNQTTPTAAELAHYDIGPLVNGQPNPNGKIEIVDAILILRKALGLKSW
jgi:hypothetical protein